MPFDFHMVPRILFGRGEFERIGGLAAEFGRSALVVTNAGPSSAELLGRLEKLLGAAGLKTAVFTVEGEPEIEDVDGGVEAARRAGAELIVGLGGGSALDTGKAVAGLLANGGTALDYMEVIGKGRKITRPGAPWIAVPTTAGTGAEATCNAVIGCKAKHFKASIRSEKLLARVALVDPVLGVGVRPDVTARCGMDALTQCLEAYTSKGAQPLTDALALEGLRRAGRALRRAYQGGQDLGAREDMALAALLGGIALANAGLGAVHGFAAPMGARFPIPHGTVCAALLPHVMAANIGAAQESPEGAAILTRYAEAGRALTGRREEFGDRPDVRSVSEFLAAGLDFVQQLARELAIPRLGGFGVTEGDIGEMVGLARKASSMKFNPVELSEEALAGVLRAAL
jgi:alcohol dehydrogenase class IV